MHSCLQIDDIFVEILNHVERDADLLYLALVCRTFYEPTMDALWAKTPWVLGKLLLCLPSDAIEAVCRDDWPSVSQAVDVRISRTPSTSEWRRFLHHAARVKYAKLEDPYVMGNYHKTVSVSAETLDAIGRSIPSRPIFPSLRGLDMQLQFSSYFQLLCHRNLSLVRIQVGWCSDRVVQPILSELLPSGPQLESLEISSPHENLDVAASDQATLIISTQKLRHLLTHIPLSLSTLAQSTSLRTLESISLHASLMTDSHSTVASTGPFHFPALLELRLRGHPTVLSRALRLASMPILTRLELALPEAPAADESTSILPNISAYGVNQLAAVICRFSSLEELKVYIDPSPPLSHVLTPSQLLAGEALRPLTALQNLTVLDMPTVSVDLHPEDVASMARSWPRLRELRIGGSCIRPGRRPFPTSICTEDLYPFAQHCPSLSKLAITVAASVKRAGSRSLVTGDEELVPHGSLRILHLMGSTVHSAWECTRIATFVVTVFPNALDRTYVGGADTTFKVRAIMHEQVVLAETIALRSHPL